MIENSKNETTLELNRVEKKEWKKPKMARLNVKETKNGSHNAWSEDGFLGWITGGTGYS